MSISVDDTYQPHTTHHDVEKASQSTARPKKRRRTEAELQKLATDFGSDQEEPVQEVLSRKEQRKRKKASVNAAIVPVSATPSAAAPSSTARAVRSQYGVWIGNLAFHTTEVKLESFLMEGGCAKPTRINMPNGKGPNEINRGYAYIDFEHEAAAETAISLSEGHLDGRKLLIKAHTDFSGRPESAALTLGGQALSKTAKRIVAQQKNQAAPCLFVGNLAYDVTETSLQKFIEGNHIAALKWVPKHRLAAMHGDARADGIATREPEEDLEEQANARIRATVGIRKVRVGTFEDSGKCKGWAFIDFRTVQEATYALLNTRNHRMGPRDIVLEYASADAVRRGGGSVKRPARRTHTQSDSDPTGPAPIENAAVERPSTPSQASAHHNVPPSKHATSNPSPTRPNKRAPPGAVLANAQRAKVGIAHGAPVGKKTIF